MPSMDGMTVSAPVLIMICLAVNSNSSAAVRTDTVSEDTKEPNPV